MKIVNFNLLAFTSSMYAIEYIHSGVEEMRNERRNGIAIWIKNEYTNCRQCMLLSYLKVRILCIKINSYK